MKQKSVYLAGPWFSPYQAKRLDLVLEALKANKTIDSDMIYQPEEHQNEQFKFGSTKWLKATYSQDVRHVTNSDVVVAILDYKTEEGNFEPDSGTIFEIGYAIAMHKPVILVKFDEREDDELNLMLSGEYTAMFYGSEEISSELPKYDFNSLDFKETVMKVF